MKSKFFWKGFVFYFTILTAIAMIVSTCLLIPELHSSNQGAYWLLGFNFLALVAVAFIHYNEFVDHDKHYKAFVYDTYSVKHITGYYHIAKLLRHIPYFRKKHIQHIHDLRLTVRLLQHIFKEAPNEDVFLQSILKEIGN